MLLGVLLCLFAGGNLRINTYYSMPVGYDSFAVDDQNICYFLDKKEKKIIVFDSSGKQINEISRPGQGVGDLAWPQRMYLEEDKLVVIEDHFINIFKTDGEFVSKKRTPLSGHMITMWFGDSVVAYANKFKNSESFKLEFFDADFNPFGETILYNWEYPLFSTGYNPSISGINVVQALSERHIYIVFSDEFKVVFVDIEKRKVVNEIVLPLDSIPFNEAWGDKKFEDGNERWRQIERRMGITPSKEPRRPKAFPRHFPIVRDAYHDLKGNIVVSLWTGNPDKVFNLKAFNAQGEEVPVEYEHPDTYRRLLARRNGYVYLWDYNMEDEESHIVRVKEEKVNEFAKQNPLTFELVGQHLAPRN